MTYVRCGSRPDVGNMIYADCELERGHTEPHIDRDFHYDETSLVAIWHHDLRFVGVGLTEANARIDLTAQYRRDLLIPSD